VRGWEPHVHYVNISPFPNRSLVAIALCSALLWLHLVIGRQITVVDVRDPRRRSNGFFGVLAASGAEADPCMMFRCVNYQAEVAAT
jgi:hypothetical protein